MHVGDFVACSQVVAAIEDAEEKIVYAAKNFFWGAKVGTFARGVPRKTLDCCAR